MKRKPRKPCVFCRHGKAKHRTHGCIQTWQTQAQTFMGIRTVTRWCVCPGYKSVEQAEAER